MSSLSAVAPRQSARSAEKQKCGLKVLWAYLREVKNNAARSANNNLITVLQRILSREARKLFCL